LLNGVQVFPFTGDSGYIDNLVNTALGMEIQVHMQCHKQSEHVVLRQRAQQDRLSGTLAIGPRA
jgi:hypothetical protein